MLHLAVYALCGTLLFSELYVVVRPSVCLLSVIEIFGNVSTPFGTLVICDLTMTILRRSSQGNPSGEGLNQTGSQI